MSFFVFNMVLELILPYKIGTKWYKMALNGTNENEIILKTAEMKNESKR